MPDFREFLPHPPWEGPPIPKAFTTKMSEDKGREIAETLDVYYNGMQAPSEYTSGWYVFTDYETHGTFNATTLGEAALRLAQLRKQFKGG